MLNSRQRAHEFLSPVVFGLLGRRSGDFSFRLYEGEGVSRSGNGLVFMEPAEGEVVGVGSEFVAVRTGTTRFDVVAASFLDAPVAVGQKVKLRYYAMRRFDGGRVGMQSDLSGSMGLVAAHAGVSFPVRWDGRHLSEDLAPLASRFPVARTRALQVLCTALEQQMCDTLRNIPALLVDAGARSVRTEEIPTEMLFGKPVADTGVARLLVAVHTRRFSGTVAMGFDENLNRFSLTLAPSAAAVGAPEHWADLRPDSLATLLNERVDDGAWRQVKVEVLEPAPLPPTAAERTAAAQAAAQAARTRGGRHGLSRWPLWLLIALIAATFVLTDGAGLWVLLGKP